MRFIFWALLPQQNAAPLEKTPGHRSRKLCGQELNPRRMCFAHRSTLLNYRTTFVLHSRPMAFQHARLSILVGSGCACGVLPACTTASKMHASGLEPVLNTLVGVFHGLHVGAQAHALLSTSSPVCTPGSSGQISAFPDTCAYKQVTAGSASHLFPSRPFRLSRGSGSRTQDTRLIRPPF